MINKTAKLFLPLLGTDLLSLISLKKKVALERRFFEGANNGCLKTKSLERGDSQIKN